MRSFRMEACYLEDRDINCIISMKERAFDDTQRGLRGWPGRRLPNGLCDLCDRIGAIVWNDFLQRTAKRFSRLHLVDNCVFNDVSGRDKNALSDMKRAA